METYAPYAAHFLLPSPLVKQNSKNYMFRQKMLTRPRLYPVLLFFRSARSPSWCGILQKKKSFLWRATWRRSANMLKKKVVYLLLMTSAGKRAQSALSKSRRQDGTTLRSTARPAPAKQCSRARRRHFCRHSLKKKCLRLPRYIHSKERFAPLRYSLHHFARRTTPPPMPHLLVAAPYRTREK